MEILSVFIIFVIMVIAFYRLGKNSVNEEISDNARLHYANSMKAQLEVLEIKRELETQKEAYNTLLGQKKSSEVKVGFLAEALAPLHKDFPVPPETCRFLGAPFDFVSFDLENERIVFIECKSNGSVLSPKQKKLKQIILDGKVEFAEVRIGKDGVTSKVSSKA